jgi:hypothetical protein
MNKYKEKLPPNRLVDCLHRPPDELPTMNELELTLVEQMTKEDAILAQGLEKFGLTVEEAAIAYQMQQFHKTQFVASVQILGGSMTRICLKMQTQLDELAKRLVEVREKLSEKTTGPISRQTLVDEEKHLMRTFHDFADQTRRMFDTSQRAAMLSAMIRFKLQGGRKKVQDARKPGFSPSYIDTEPTNQPNDRSTKDSQTSPERP